MATGIDVGAVRVSYLGKEALRFALSGDVPSKVYLELGPGRGRLATIFSLLGFQCYLYDNDPTLVEHYSSLNGCFGVEGRIRFYLKDAREIRYRDLPKGLGVVVAERFLHHLKFSESLRLLRMLRNRMLPRSRIFLSVSGILSPIGEGYPHSKLPVGKRYAPLSPHVAEKFKISGKVCLYLPKDIRNLMKSVGGFKELTVKTTNFGNVVAIYEREGDL